MDSLGPPDTGDKCLAGGYTVHGKSLDSKSTWSIQSSEITPGHRIKLDANDIQLLQRAENLEDLEYALRILGGTHVVRLDATELERVERAWNGRPFDKPETFRILLRCTSPNYLV